MAEGGAASPATSPADRVDRLVQHVKDRHMEERLDPEAEEHPETVRRSCTDVAWLWMFTVACLLLGAALTFSDTRGAASRILVLRDWQGAGCGVQETYMKPYLFICRSGTNGSRLVVSHPICVESCPNSTDTWNSCYNNAADEWSERDDYPTVPYAGVFCVATNSTFREQQRLWMADNTNLLQRAYFMVQMWKPVLLVVVMSIIFSNLYILMLGTCASTLVWIGLFMLSVVPLCFGAYFLRTWYLGHSLLGAVLGVGLVITGVSFCAIACCASYNMDKATVLIELSCKCYVGNPIIRIGPLLMTIIRFAVDLFVIQGMLGIYSLSEYDNETMRFTPHLSIKVFLGLGVLMLIWINSIMDCASDFLLAYITEVWYFNGGIHDLWKPKPSDFLKGGWIMLRYHMGTVIQGGLIVGFFKPVRFLVGTLTAPSRSSIGLPLVTCIVDNCCWCLVDIYRDHMELVSRNLILDTARTGRPFWPAAKNSLDVVRTDDGTFRLLNGATWFFQVAGVGLIVLLGNIQTFLILTCFPELAGPMGSFLGEGAEIASYVYMCACVAGITAVPYMLVFDTVSDTILYCHLVAKQRAAKKQQASSYMADVATYVWELLGGGCGGYRGKSPDNLEAQGREVMTRAVQLEASSDSSDSASEDGSDDHEVVKVVPAPAPPGTAAPQQLGPMRLASAPQPLRLTTPAAVVMASPSPSPPSPLLTRPLYSSRSSVALGQRLLGVGQSQQYYQLVPLVLPSGPAAAPAPRVQRAASPARAADSARGGAQPPAGGTDIEATAASTSAPSVSVSPPLPRLPRQPAAHCVAAQPTAHSVVRQPVTHSVVRQPTAGRV